VQKVLVANRGEIALRVVRACRALGLGSVAVYSEADRAALHVRAADEAQALGGADPAESYLNIPAVIRAARASGVDALHPGYGFLSENPDLAAACAEAGLTFVGPPASVLALCGDKAATRRRVVQAGVPVLPGTDPVDDRAAAAAARKIGAPLLIKAASGGGGKGIHRVDALPELPAALRLARGEAQAAFGDDRVYLERWLPRPRHVEVQILADGGGSVVHLGERECSIQRRHQKLIEEAPAPHVGEGTREAIRRAAVAAAGAVGYRNAGTVEFLLAGTEFFFLEINARLQVEHPVTEAVTGLDLVALQLHIAAGRPLPLRQHDVRFHGHAIECRVSAEDVDQHFLPWVGRVGHVLLPGGPGVRVDGALAPGMEVTRYYDPLLAKVIASGATREEAIARMAGALREMAVTGVPTTLPFHRWAMVHPAFRAGRYATDFVEAEWRGAPAADAATAALAAGVLAHCDDHRVPLLPEQPADGWTRAARRDALS
jgi:acetyl-CoA carboxylase biotin carboxylase subunit